MTPPSPQPNPLTAREREVAGLVLEGQTNKQIALALSISERTVEFHLKNIYDKLQVRSRVELVRKLGTSTVENGPEFGDNRDRPSEWRWTTHLKAAVSKIGKELNVSSWLNTPARPAGSPMGFFDAIRVCLGKYAEFAGRASRPEFWWFVLFVTLATTALMYVNENVSAIFVSAMVLPLLAAGARRLRDSGKSGWWQLFLLVPVAGMVLVGILWALPPAPDTQPA